MTPSTIELAVTADDHRIARYAAAAIALAVNAPGHLSAYKTTRLMTPEEFLAAQQKAHGVSFAAPSKG